MTYLSWLPKTVNTYILTFVVLQANLTVEKNVVEGIFYKHSKAKKITQINQHKKLSTKQITWSWKNNVLMGNLEIHCLAFCQPPLMAVEQVETGMQSPARCRHHGKTLPSNPPKAGSATICTRPSILGMPCGLREGPHFLFQANGSVSRTLHSSIKNAPLDWR